MENLKKIEKKYKISCTGDFFVVCLQRLKDLQAAQNRRLMSAFFVPTYTILKYRHGVCGRSNAHEELLVSP